MSFAEASAVVPQDGTKYTGRIRPGWDIFGVANGGYVMTIAARAMGQVAQQRELISITGYFTNPGRPGPVTVQVRPIKVGKGFSTSQADVMSEERPLLSVIGTYAKPDRTISESKLFKASSFDLPSPSECVQAKPSPDGPFPPPLMDKVSVMIHPEDAAGLMGKPTGIARVRGWFRLLEDESPDPLAVVLACDAFPPALFNTDLPRGWTPTLDLTVHIRDPRPTGWLKCQFRTRFVTGGFLEEDCEIWDEKNNLVAQSRQLALAPG